MSATIGQVTTLKTTHLTLTIFYSTRACMEAVCHSMTVVLEILNKQVVDTAQINLVHCPFLSHPTFFGSNDSLTEE
jgi:hypothetical protein